MKIVLRKEEPQDYEAVERITREAFWNVHQPGCDEHYLVRIMRKSEDFIPELAVVAETDDGRLAGNVMYSRAYVLGDDGKKTEALTLGPISVLPEFQGMGIGQKMIAYGNALARKMGFRAVFLYGDPDYYSRSGFEQAEKYKIGTEWDTYAVPLQVCALYKDSLSGLSGRFFESKVFDVDAEAAAEFDKKFPHKEKVTGLPSQLRFQEMIKANKPRV